MGSNPINFNRGHRLWRAGALKKQRSASSRFVDSHGSLIRWMAVNVLLVAMPRDLHL